MKPIARKFHGLTLMEALLFLGLAAIVIVGAFSLYNTASGSTKMNQARTQLQSYVGNIKSLYSTTNNFSSVATDVIISANLAPSEAVDGAQLINPWGGTTEIAGAARTFTITFNDIPDAACTAMLSSGLINQGTIISISANGGTSYTSDIDPGTAIGECNNGDANAVTFTSR